MNMNLFLAYCDVDPNNIVFVCKHCGAEYSLIELEQCYNLDEIFVRGFAICPFEDTFNLMVTFKSNEVDWNE